MNSGKTENDVRTATTGYELDTSVTNETDSNLITQSKLAEEGNIPTNSPKKETNPTDTTFKTDNQGISNDIIKKIQSWAGLTGKDIDGWYGKTTK